MALILDISEAAERDLEEIFNYIHSKHGINQAYRYVSSFDGIFQNLALHPEIGRERPEIREGLYSMSKDHHIIFYRIHGGKLRIIRVLHGARDLPRQFDV